MRIRYPTQIEARRQVAHSYFGRLLLPICRDAGHPLRRLRVQPSYGRGWSLFLAVEGVDEPLVIDATRTDVHTPWETECWGFDFLPPTRDDGAEAYRSLCATVCGALAAREPVPPPMLIEEPAQLVREPVEGVELDSLCDRGCIFCGVNYRRVHDSSVPSWSEATTDAQRKRLEQEALDSWPRVELRLEKIAAAGGRGTVTWRGADALASPIFERALRRARALGLSGMDVQTPGTALAEPDFVDFLREHGVESFHLTAHAFSAPLFDRIAGLDGAYQLFWAAVANLLERALMVYVEVPCTSENAHEIPDLLAALSRLPVRVSMFYWFPEPQFAAGYEALPMDLPAAIDVLVKAKTRIPVDLLSVSGIPACAIPRELIDHFRWYTANKHLRSNKLSYAESCVRCAVQRECVGVPSEFLDHHALPEPIRFRGDPRASLVIDGPRKPPTDGR